MAAAQLGILLIIILHCEVLAQIPDHVAALLAFRDGVSDDPQGLIRGTWKAASLDSKTGCPLQWHGVTCNNGSITGLSLTDLGLVGVIQPATLGRLSSLTTLNLANNSFSGILPDDLGNLSSIQAMDLSDNLLQGWLPQTLGGLKNMMNLSLSGNQFQGLIPDVFENLTQLLDLDLARNSFSGNIPSSFSKLEQLVSFNVSYNNLNGSIPGEFTNLENTLVNLDLHQNSFSGEVDPLLMGLRSVQHIDLSCNQLSGPLPWQQGAPFNFPREIVSVNLSFNQFSGELAPEDAASLFATELQILDVSSNKLSGNLPAFPFVYSLRVLKLQNNSFSGIVPPAFLAKGESVLEELDISMNNLTGSIGTITSSSLSSLNLSSNGLSGTLPIRFGSCATVDFSNNRLSGNLSVMRDWQDGLEFLDLSNNVLDGFLPNETEHLLRLMHLNFSSNNLSGPIPSFFASFHKLTTLDLSSNSFQDEIPGDFFHSASLSTLRLSDNRLVGGLPVNNLMSSSAVVPGGLLSPSSTVTVPPTIIFSPLQVLDLSGNRLNGSIPRELASLSTLVVLDLSKNNFSGPVPSQLSLLRYLEDLDLSFNQLTGHIPPHLPESLLKLNVSYNRLSGVIPKDLVERHFPASSFFPGNLGLSFPRNAEQDRPASSSYRYHKKGLSSAVKAGLIGGCVAGLAMLVAAILFIYYRNHSKTQDIEKADDDKPASPQRLEASVDPYSGSISFSREQLLPAVRAPPEEARNIHTEGLDLARKSESSSPSRRRNKGQPLLLEEEGTSSLERSSSTRVRSPDKLAGDIYLLDTSFTFTAEDLSSAPAEVLGRSSHGTSYKATLDHGHVLTVKWLREGLAKNKKSFTSEAKKFGNIKHPNIMPLRGYYWGPREHEKLLISDYVSYGSLADRLSERSGRRFPPLNWSQRVYIAVGIAQGLSYLHLKHKLPHGNLKASNVLLEGAGLVARLSDYSIHRLMTNAGTANQILNAGALGYRAPELADARRPKPTLKADVYAFGVMLMEIVTGKGAGDIISGNSGAVDLTDWVKLLVTQDRAPECYDQTLIGYDRDQEPPRRINDILDLALRCISLRLRRPGIRLVLEELSAMAIE